MINLPIVEYQFKDKFVNAVNSRDLYQQLNLGKGQYSRWIKLNLYENPFFVENIDFVRVRHNVEGNEVVSAIVTIDTAKHLAMVSRSKEAHQIRNYFIEVEKKFRLQNQISETQTDRELKGLDFVFKTLRPSEASKIGMTKTLFTQIGLNTSYLPKYSDEEHTYSAKALLEKFEIKISVQQFNKQMISAGLLETKTRKSSKYRTEKDVNGKEVKIPILKEFKSLTEKGLEFGKNIISPKNQLESQPHYFEKKFSELLKTLGY
jgi:phage anti-repressor protein/ribosomal protein L7/L12